MNSVEEYACRIIVDERLKWDWKFIKRELSDRVMREVIPPMIDSGHYHVVKFDISKRPYHDVVNGWSEYRHEYRIIAQLSIAKEINVNMVNRSLPDFGPLMERKEKAEKVFERVCLHCGNAITKDGKNNLTDRGGCKSCGAPNGGYKEG